VEGPIRIRELGDIAPEIPVAQSVPNQNRLSSKADLKILSSFPRKTMNTKVEYNFVAHNAIYIFVIVLQSSTYQSHIHICSMITKLVDCKHMF
jgi:hypothetical protein